MNLEFDAEQEVMIGNAARLFEQLDALGRYRADEVGSLWSDLVGAGWSELGEPLESGSLDLGTALGIFRAAGSQLIVEDLTTSAYLLQSLIAHCSESTDLFKSALSETPGAILGDNRLPELDVGAPERGLCFTSAEVPAVFRLATEGHHGLRLGLAVDAKVTSRRVGDGLSFTSRYVDVDGGRWVYAPLDLDGPDLQRIVRTAALLHSAARIGAAERAIEMTREYTLNRFQFDVPIGSFQAVKHLLADALAVKEVAWNAALCAAADASHDEYRNLVARWLCLEAALQAGRTAAQLHGGIGFTWEFDLHFVLKTILDSSARFGSTDALSIAIGDLFVARARVQG